MVPHLDTLHLRDRNLRNWEFGEGKCYSVNGFRMLRTSMPKAVNSLGADPNCDVQAESVHVLFQRIARNLELISHDSYIDDIRRATELVSSCFSAGGKLLVFGNGG